MPIENSIYLLNTSSYFMLRNDRLKLTCALNISGMKVVHKFTIQANLTLNNVLKVLEVSHEVHSPGKSIKNGILISKELKAVAMKKIIDNVTTIAAKEELKNIHKELLVDIIR